ncbi:MAG: hypothetical protein R3D60_13350 [Paracoccaceae bacterium]
MERAVKAARNAGVEVGGVEIAKDGTIRVMVKTETANPPPKTDLNSWDDVLR